MTYLKSKFVFFSVCVGVCVVGNGSFVHTNAHRQTHTMVFNQSPLCYALLFLSPATKCLFPGPHFLFVSLFCDPLTLIRVAYVGMNMDNFLDLEQISVTTPFRNITSLSL